MQFSGDGLLARTYFPPLDQDAVDPIVKAALDGGIDWFDTAEMYGGGKSERSLGTALRHGGVTPGDVTIATKWSPLLRTARNIERTVGNRRAALQPFRVDLHQIHLGQGSFSPVREQMRAMARLVERGLISAVGVSNFSAEQMQDAHAVLADHGIPLATNQVQVNLVHRDIETNGVLDTARRLGVTLIAYSPLRSGLLTGKFHADRSLVDEIPPLRRKMTGFTDEHLGSTASLIGALREIAEGHDATVSQIALAWLIGYYDDTVVAIPGASRPHHAAEAAGALRVQLSNAELEHLAQLSRAVTR